MGTNRVQTQDPVRGPFTRVRAVLLCALLVGAGPVACGSPGGKSATAPGSDEPSFAGGLQAFRAGAYGDALASWSSAAQAGDAGAQNGLGWLYSRGLGVSRDYAAAVEWYRRAANQGHGGAQLNLGNHLYYGLGVPRNAMEAARQYERAAEKGYAVAQHNLARMYSEGTGVARNATTAAQLMRKAAGAGYPLAQNSLGLMYFEGSGVARDLPRALFWLMLATRSGVPGAEHNRDFVASFLDPAQIAATRETAQQWQPTADPT